MPKLIRAEPQPQGPPRMAWAEDSFVHLADDEPAPQGDRANAHDVIVSLTRFQAEGEARLAEGRRVGVRLRSDEAVEGVVYDLPRLALVALDFPKYRDGRAYTSAELLRTRYGYTGEVRAVGAVQRDQAAFMVRCGFDAFEPCDGSTPAEWAKSAFGYSHVYQAAADDRPAAFTEREAAGAASRSGG